MEHKSYNIHVYITHYYVMLRKNDASVDVIHE